MILPGFVNDVHVTFFKVEFPVFVIDDKFTFWLNVVEPLKVDNSIPQVKILVLLFAC